MNCRYVRETYGVDAEIGRRIIMNEKPGIIAQDMGNYIGVNFDTDKPGVVLPCHPTWKMEYLEMGEVRIRKMTRSQKRYQKFKDAEDWYGGTFAEWLGID